MLAVLAAFDHACRACRALGRACHACRAVLVMLAILAAHGRACALPYCPGLPSLPRSACSSPRTMARAAGVSWFRRRLLRDPPSKFGLHRQTVSAAGACHVPESFPWHAAQTLPAYVGVRRVRGCAGCAGCAGCGLCGGLCCFVILGGRRMQPHGLWTLCPDTVGSGHCSHVGSGHCAGLWTLCGAA
jgi:hypothetical protein